MLRYFRVIQLTVSQIMQMLSCSHQKCRLARPPRTVDIEDVARAALELLAYVIGPIFTLHRRFLNGDFISTQ